MLMKKIISFAMALIAFFSTNSFAQYVQEDNGWQNGLAKTTLLYTEDLYCDGVSNVYYNEYDYFPTDLLYRWLSISDLYGLDCGDLRILRNAIYAYHGYIFSDQSLYLFFSQYRWYNPRYKNQNSITKKLTKTEKHNIEIIRQRERQLGC